MYERHQEASKIVSSRVDNSKTFEITGIARAMSDSFGIGFPLIRLAKHHVQFHANIEFWSANYSWWTKGWIAPTPMI